MRISLISMFILTAFVAALLWDVRQAQFIADFKSHFSLTAPEVRDDQVAYTSVSQNDAIIEVGNTARACVRMKRQGDGGLVTLFEEVLGPGRYALSTSRRTGIGSGSSFHMSVNGKHCSVDDRTSCNFPMIQDSILTGSQECELMRTIGVRPLQAFFITLTTENTQSKATDSP